MCKLLKFCGKEPFKIQLKKLFLLSCDLNMNF
jgi:hypothetical protein